MQDAETLCEEEIKKGRIFGKRVKRIWAWKGSIRSMQRERERERDLGFLFIEVVSEWERKEKWFKCKEKWRFYKSRPKLSVCCLCVVSLSLSHFFCFAQERSKEKPFDWVSVTSLTFKDWFILIIAISGYFDFDEERWISSLFSRNIQHYTTCARLNFNQFCI